MGALAWVLGLGGAALGGYLATRKEPGAASSQAPGTVPASSQAPGTTVQPAPPGFGLSEQQLDAISRNEGGVRVFRDPILVPLLKALSQNKVTPAWVGYASSTGPLKYSLTFAPGGGNAEIFVQQSQANGWLVGIPVQVLYPHLAGERHLMLFSSVAQVMPGYVVIPGPGTTFTPSVQPPAPAPPAPPAPVAIPVPAAPWAAPAPAPAPAPTAPSQQPPPGGPIYIPSPGPGVPTVIASPVPIPVPVPAYPTGQAPGPPPATPAPVPAPAIPAVYLGKNAAELRAAATQLKASSPELASALEAKAAEVYRTQREEAVRRGGSSFKVLKNHIPYEVSEHYTGNQSRWREIDPLNPGMNLAKQIGWSGKTVLLPLDWDIENKLPAPTSGSATKASVVAATKLG